MTRFLKFSVVGTIGFVVDAGILQVLAAGGGMNPYLARVFSFLGAATVTWWLNRRYTFEVRHGATQSEWLAYVALMVVGALVNYGAYAAAITWWPFAREHLWAGVAVGSIAGLGVNYLTSSRLAFRRDRP